MLWLTATFRNVTKTIKPYYCHVFNQPETAVFSQTVCLYTVANATKLQLIKPSIIQRCTRSTVWYASAYHLIWKSFQCNLLIDNIDLSLLLFIPYTSNDFFCCCRLSLFLCSFDCLRICCTHVNVAFGNLLRLSTWLAAAHITWLISARRSTRSAGVSHQLDDNTCGVETASGEGSQWHNTRLSHPCAGNEWGKGTLCLFNHHMSSQQNWKMFYFYLTE